MATPLIMIFPEELEFGFELNSDTLITASLRNVAPCHIGYKIKTTATDRYRVRPNIGRGNLLYSDISL